MLVQTSTASDAVTAPQPSRLHRPPLRGEDAIGGRSIRLRPGETLFRAGARASDIYYVADGLVRAEHAGLDGIREILGTFGRGDVIGLTFLRVAAFTVTAVQPSRLIAYSSTGLSRAVAEHSRAVARLAAFAAKPLSNVLGFLHICHARRPSARIAAYVLFQFDRRGDVRHNIETVDLRGSPSEWANLLNVTPDHVERGLAELFANNALKRLHATRVALIDRKRIEELAGLPS
jgi:CRP-like cAMP-binding protein